MIPTALDVLHQLAASDGARPAAEHLHDDGSFTRLSYGRLARTVASAARALHLRHSIGRGHVVGIAVPDGLDMIVAELATWATGAAVVPMDPCDAPERLAYIMANSAPKIVICRQEDASRMRSVRSAAIASGKVTYLGYRTMGEDS
jgi:acyl-CoA synthetase (AMP-forming)/AMP-acid ligase II